MATEVLGIRFQELLQRPLSGERDVCLERVVCATSGRLPFSGHSLKARILNKSGSPGLVSSVRRCCFY